MIRLASFVALGNIDQIGATIRRNDHVRPVAIATDQTVAVLGVLVFADGAVAVVWVDERQIKPRARSRATKPSGRCPGSASG